MSSARLLNDWLSGMSGTCSIVDILSATIKWLLNFIEPCVSKDPYWFLRFLIGNFGL